MSFSFGNPAAAKTTAGLPTSTVAATTPASTVGGGFSFNLNPQPGLFAPPTTTTAAAASGGGLFGNLSGKPITTAPATNFSTGSGSGDTTTAISSTTTAPSLGGLKFGAAPVTTTTSFAPILSGTTSSTIAPTFGISQASSVAKTSSNIALTASPAVMNLAITTSATTTTTTAPAVTTTTTSTTMTFAQLEDSINRWSIDLEEQGKFFINQAKHLNAWDSFLISNGEQILTLSGSIQKVKQQQSQLDQELDFVLAQQKELEELIVPLEKELIDLPITDVDRNQMYQFSEIIDSQLKQISDDLKEIIDSVNEGNKEEEDSNPISQISKILNLHMNSLQWIDRNTSQISRQLDEVSKLEGALQKNATNLSFNQ